MAITDLEFNDRYIVHPADTTNVIVRVIIGNGQTGGYLIYFDGTQVAFNKDANLNAANKLAGKQCIITADVNDLRDETNWTSVTVELQNGTTKKVYGPYSHKAVTNGDTISYAVIIDFQNA